MIASHVPLGRTVSAVSHHSVNLSSSWGLSRLSCPEQSKEGFGSHDCNILVGTEGQQIPVARHHIRRVRRDGTGQNYIVVGITHDTRERREISDHLEGAA